MLHAPTKAAEHKRAKKKPKHERVAVRWRPTAPAECRALTRPSAACPQVSCALTNKRSVRKCERKIPGECRLTALAYGGALRDSTVEVPLYVGCEGCGASCCC